MFKDLSGQKFNKWTVLSYAGITGSRSRDRTYLCRCECGVEKTVKGYYLTKGYSKQCVDCAHKNQRKYRDISFTYWKTLVGNAKKRGIDFDITLEQVYDMYLKQGKKCALSGVEIYFSVLETEHLNKLTTASVDRIDSSKGYSLNNIQVVHKDINIMKNSLSDKNFIDYCRKVVAYNDK